MINSRNPGRWRPKLWILLGCGISAALILTLLREREPQYQGKSLSQWIMILDHGEQESWREAQSAVRHIGTNGIPFLLKWLQYQQRPWRTRLGALCYRLPEKLAEPLANFVVGNGFERRQASLSALYALGADGKPAIPLLATFIETQPQSAKSCMMVLANMGDVALPTLLPIFTNKTPATIQRCVAIDTIGTSWNQFGATNLIQSALVACLGDTDREVALHAAGVLCSHQLADVHPVQVFTEMLKNRDGALRNVASLYLNENLSKSFPAATLIRFLQDTNSALSEYAAAALGDKAELGSTPPEDALPALIHSLHDPRLPVRLHAAGALGHFKNGTETAAPALLDAWNDPDDSVRQMATNALLALPGFRELRVAAQLQPLPPGMNQEQIALYKRYWPDSSALVRLLNHPDLRVREMATNAFRKFREASGEVPISQPLRR